jgi:hypothetical protein
VEPTAETAKLPTAAKSTTVETAASSSSASAMASAASLSAKCQNPGWRHEAHTDDDHNHAQKFSRLLHCSLRSCCQETLLLAYKNATRLLGGGLLGDWRIGAQSLPEIALPERAE